MNCSKASPSRRCFWQTLYTGQRRLLQLKTRLRLCRVREETMKRSLLTSAVILFLASACGNQLTPEEERQLLILQQLGCHLPCLSTDSQTIFSIEKLGEGYAVIVEAKTTSGQPDERYAYWVHEGNAYTVNDAAAKCSPGLPAAPKEITYEAVSKAIREAQQNLKYGTSTRRQ